MLQGFSWGGVATVAVGFLVGALLGGVVARVL
jgi:hypothetical protein